MLCWWRNSRPLLLLLLQLLLLWLCRSLCRAMMCLPNSLQGSESMRVAAAQVSSTAREFEYGCCLSSQCSAAQHLCQPAFSQPVEDSRTATAVHNAHRQASWRQTRYMVHAIRLRFTTLLTWAAASPALVPASQ
jgi:hypothetical protein